MQDDVLHPRPQLTRARWTDLGGIWQFAYDDANVGLHDRWVDHPELFDRTIVVPFPPESRASGIGDIAFHPVVWYRRSFEVAPEDRRQHLRMHFGAVDYRAQVWVNGHLVAEHVGGNTPFSADVTPVLADGPEQVVVIRAEDQPLDLAQPRGKQYWKTELDNIWYHRTTGIWQPVWLEPVGATHIAELRWTPDVEHSRLGIEVRLNRPAPAGQPLKLHVRLTMQGALLADDTYTIERQHLMREIVIEPYETNLGSLQILWSPRFPNLIDAVLQLQAGDDVVDEVQSYAGMRSVGFSNGRFLLNGRPYYLRMVLEQGYWPETHLAAPSAAALRQEVELTKALGFNGVRIHQKVEDPRFLYWCDRLGLLVWGEMANAYVFSHDAVQRLTAEWLAVVRRDYSHPCIVTWVPLNESWGVPNLETDRAQQAYVQALYYLTHALDRTRPVIGNDGWEHIASDVWGVHDYSLDGASLLERYRTPEAVARTLRDEQPVFRTLVLPEYERNGEPIMLTECGGISYRPAGGTKWFGYSTVTTPEEYLAKYEELIGAILACPTIAGFCYTQLTDTEQEVNGLLTAEREPKLDPHAIRAITSRPSEAIPGDILLNIFLDADATGFQSERS